MLGVSNSVSYKSRDYIQDGTREKGKKEEIYMKTPYHHSPRLTLDAGYPPTQR